MISILEIFSRAILATVPTIVGAILASQGHSETECFHGTILSSLTLIIYFLADVPNLNKRKGPKQ